MRIGINFGNALLATRDPASGQLTGVAVDLARELGKRASVGVELIGYSSAGKMAADAKRMAWDAAFLAIDPERAGEITFTAPYLEIDTSYLVPPGSTLQRIDDVDRAGIRIAVSENSAYDLFLSRHLRHATLVRAASVDASISAFTNDALEAVAGLKPLLLSVAQNLAGARVLEGRIGVVQQAIGVPKANDAIVPHLRAFVEDVKASGFVAEQIRKHGINGVSVAPPAP